LDMSNQSVSPEAVGAISFSHIIWPETALTFLLTEAPDAIRAISQVMPSQSLLLTGAVRAERPSNDHDPMKVYNSLYALNGQAEILAAQDKQRLVPFGEFLPLTGMLDFLGIAPRFMVQYGFSPGAQQSVMELADTPKFLPLICYEVIFQPKFNKEADAQWLLNITNDAWFGNTPGPYQHLRLAQLRAASQGVPLVRVANTGISAIIDPLGRIQKQLPLGERGILDGTLPKPVGISSRFHHRDEVFWVFVLVFFALGGISVLQKRK